MCWTDVLQDEQLVDKAVLALLRICDAFSGKPSLLEKLSGTQLITTTFDMVSISANKYMPRRFKLSVNRPCISLITMWP